jgi:hypothetical protein
MKAHTRDRNSDFEEDDSKAGKKPVTLFPQAMSQ